MLIPFKIFRKNYRNLFLVILLSMLHTSCAVNKGFYNNEIIWEENKLLNVNNFFGEIDSTSTFTATTYWGIRWRHIENYGWVLYAYFDKYKSWGKKNTYKVLTHEQYHFNIAEIFARIIRKSIHENNMQIGSIEFSEFFHLKLSQCKRMQKKYDEETNHSKNKTEQKRWEDEIDTQLDDLKMYKSMNL